MPTNWYETPWNPFYFGRDGDYVRSQNLWLPGLLCLLIITLTARRRGKPVGYIVCVYIFAAYVWVFLDKTVFPFFKELGLNEFPYRAFNWVPALIEGTDPEFRIENEQVWGNFLAGVPFGFGFPFIASPKNSAPRRMIVFGLAWAVFPEFLQLLQMWLFVHFIGRTVDIDDVWLCFTGTLAGYAILWLNARLYVRLDFSRGASLPVWNHFHDVLVRVGSTVSKSGNQSDRNINVNEGSSPSPPLHERSEVGEGVGGVRRSGEVTK